MLVMRLVSPTSENSENSSALAFSTELSFSYEAFAQEQIAGALSWTAGDPYCGKLNLMYQTYLILVMFNHEMANTDSSFASA